MTKVSAELDADQAAAAGDYSRARDILERAVKDGEGVGPLWSKLAAMRNATGDATGALAALDRCLAIAPLDFASLLFRATLLERAGDPQAAEAFGHALAQAPPDDRLPAAMMPAIAHARDQWRGYQQTVEARLSEALTTDLSDDERRKVARFISNFSRRTRHFHQEPTHFHYPGMPEVEFHDQALFPQLSELEASTAAIRGELDSLLAAEAAEMVPYIQYPDRVPLMQWKELNNNRDWTAIHLLRNGERIEQNARHCPQTMAALANLPQPNVSGASPNAMFSLLAPRTRIPPHTGVANTRLVCHLPLIVPQGCGFRVGATTREWRVGESFVFDDTIEHEAWNDSDQIRIVLIVDLWAPALSVQERAAVARIIGDSGQRVSGAL